jgi:hypothetical protein
MNEHCRDLFGRANRRGDKVVMQSDAAPAGTDKVVAFDEQVRRLCLRLWPGRGAAALHIAMHGGCDIRSAQRIVARQQTFTLPVFLSMMRSVVGEPFLKLAMSGSTASWWTETYEDLETVAMEKKAHALLREAEQRKARR